MLVRVEVSLCRGLRNKIKRTDGKTLLIEIRAAETTPDDRYKAPVRCTRHCPPCRYKSRPDPVGRYIYA